MEKITLKEEQLKDLEKQYYELIDELESYRKGFKSERYKSFTFIQKRNAEMQYNFMKSAINDTVNVLLIHNHTDGKLLKSAIRNRYLKFGMRWRCLKALLNTPIRTLL